MKKNDLPIYIGDEENIARFVFSPIHIKKDNSLKTNCLKPPANSEEISVNRFDFTNENFLKGKGLEMQRPPNSFLGFGIFKAKIIRENDFDIVYTPIEKKNRFHSDILIGYTTKSGVELPAEINHKFRKILKNTKLFVDTDNSQEKWVGDEIKL